MNDELVEKYDQALRNRQMIENKNIDRSDELIPAIRQKMLKTIKEFGIR